MDQDLMVDRAVHLARLGMLFKLPIVLSTVNGQPTSVVQVACELQRDWARGETAETFSQMGRDAARRWRPAG